MKDYQTLIGFALVAIAIIIAAVIIASALNNSASNIQNGLSYLADLVRTGLSQSLCKPLN